MKIDTEFQDAYQCAKCGYIKGVTRMRFGIGVCPECDCSSFRRLSIEELFDAQLTQSDKEFLSKLDTNYGRS